MIRRLPATARPGLPAAVLTRLEELGMTLWRVDLATGAVESLGKPDESGEHATPPAGLAEAVERWNTSEEPEPIELDGCWALAIPDVHRRQRVGWVVALIGPHSGLSREQAARVRRLLAWSVEDGETIASKQHDLDGVVDNLTDAYETINTLYGIGRAMGQVLSPELFLSGLAEELSHTLPFMWVACKLGVGATGDTSIDGRLFMGGDFPGTDEERDETFARAWAAGEAHRGMDAVLLGADDDLPEFLGPQLVVQPAQRGGRLAAVLVAGNRGGDGPHASSYETLLLEAAGGFLGAFLDNASLYAEQRATFVGTVKAMTAAIDAKDRYTRGHSERVAMLSRQLALASGMNEHRADEVYISGLVHDVGKIGVPEAVLCKPGRLTEEEFDLIKRHPEIGRTILEGIPSLQGVLPGVLHHHERYDGKGYPYGLAGEDIPLMARIMGIADTFDAMSSTRSYRPAMPRGRCWPRSRSAGTQFDLELARTFVTLDLSEYDRMVAAHRASEPVFEAATGIRRDAA
ncbi:MAG: HD-GYP domain-containing protein [Phycisphaerales bacterium]